MNRFFLWIIFVCLCISSYAQTLNGIVVDTSGGPIPGATLYVHETSSGIMADNYGQFQIKLKAGIYTFEFRSLGYETLVYEFDMRNQDENIKVTLKGKSFILPEVIVTRKKEDPALRVMRNAISYAPYHKNKIKSYLSEAYIKGNLKIDKIPGVIKNMKLEANDMQMKLGSFANKTFIFESSNEISFTKPDLFKQKVLAVNSSIPKEFDVDGMFQIITADIYDHSFGGFISPLSPNAFRYYNFKFADITEDNGLTIYKIQIIPKRNNNELISGYIYIIGESWDVYAAELKANVLGNVMNYTINYQQVKPQVLLPITYDMKVDVNFMGIKAKGAYFTSVKYRSVELDDISNLELDSRSKISVDIKEENISPKQKKDFEKIEELATKDNLTTKEAYKLASLMQKTTEPAEIRERKESLEIKSFNYVIVEVDSTARNKDTLYWNEVRSLPMRIEEKSILEDAKLAKSSFTSDTVKIRRKSSFTGGLIFGKRYNISDKFSIAHDGLLKVVNEYNFVDGFHIGNTLHFRYTEKKRNFNFAQSLYYSTAREKLLWRTGFTYNYSQMAPGQFQVSVGQFSNDMSATGMNRTLNSLYSLLFGNNYVSFFEEKFLKITNSKYIAHGLQLNIGALLAERKVLDNETSFNFSNKTPDANESPATDFILSSPDHKVGIGMIGLSYTPKHRYRIRNGWKVYAGSDYPSFGVRYSGGKYSETQHSFHKVEAFMHQYADLSAFSYVRYRLSGGFISGDTHFHNKEYHSLAPALVTEKSFIDNFMLLDNYTFSSNYWINTHFSYFSQYLLLKNIPFMQKLLFEECVHLKGLMSDSTRLYWEAGYSVGWGNNMRAGVFTSFMGNKFDKVGFRVYISLFN